MTRIKLSQAQIDRLTPIQIAGGYDSISAVVRSMLAIYGDAMLDRVSIVPGATPISPTTALASSNVAPIDIPNVASIDPVTAPTSLNVAPPPPKRVKFNL